MSLPAHHLPTTERNFKPVNGCKTCPVPPSYVAKELQVSYWHPKMGISFGIWAEIFWQSEIFLASLYGKPVAIRKVWDLANFVVPMAGKRCTGVTRLVLQFCCHREEHTENKNNCGLQNTILTMEVSHYLKVRFPLLIGIIQSLYSFI